MIYRILRPLLFSIDAETANRYEGPGLIHRINRELAELVGNQTFDEFRLMYFNDLD